jgi:predicted O-methyltransferase YrrM
MRKHLLIVLIITLCALTSIFLFEGIALYALLFFLGLIFVYLIKFKFDLIGQICALEKTSSTVLIHNRQNSEAYTQLTSIFQLRSTLPFTGGWAASSDFLHLIVHNVLNKKPEVLIECGSGLSTLFTAYALEKNGKGHLFSVDHDLYYMNKTKALIHEHGLTAFVTFIHGELKEFSAKDHSYTWYDCDLSNIHADMVVIDGPPNQKNQLARSPAFERILANMKDNAVVLVDDGARPDEQEMIGQWKRTAGDNWKFEYLSLEKGAFLGSKLK